MNKLMPGIVAVVVFAMATTSFADFDSVNWERVEAPGET